MIPFMFTELENIYNKLLRLVLRQSCLEKTISIANKLKRNLIENKENHLENGLIDIEDSRNKCQTRIKKEIPRRV